MKLPSEIDNTIDRRAQTIDILAAEIERKNRTIKAWRMKYDESESQSWKEKHDKLKVQLKKMTRLFKSAKMGADHVWGQLQELKTRINGKDVEEIK